MILSLVQTVFIDHIKSIISGEYREMELIQLSFQKITSLQCKIFIRFIKRITSWSISMYKSIMILLKCYYGLRIVCSMLICLFRKSIMVLITCVWLINNISKSIMVRNWWVFSGISLFLISNKFMVYVYQSSQLQINYVVSMILCKHLLVRILKHARRIETLQPLLMELQLLIRQNMELQLSKTKCSWNNLNNIWNHTQVKTTS